VPAFIDSFLREQGKTDRRLSEFLSGTMENSSFDAGRLETWACKWPIPVKCACPGLPGKSELPAFLAKAGHDLHTDRTNSSFGQSHRSRFGHPVGFPHGS
jgi:hypothetical protein